MKTLIALLTFLVLNLSFAYTPVSMLENDWGVVFVEVTDHSFDLDYASIPTPTGKTGIVVITYDGSMLYRLAGKTWQKSSWEEFEVSVAFNSSNVFNFSGLTLVSGIPTNRFIPEFFGISIVATSETVMLEGSPRVSTRQVPPQANTCVYTSIDYRSSYICYGSYGEIRYRRSCTYSYVNGMYRSSCTN